MKLTFRYNKFKWLVIIGMLGVNLISAMMIISSGALLSSYSDTMYQSSGGVFIAFLVTTIVIVVFLWGHDLAPQKKTYAIGYKCWRRSSIFGKHLNFFVLIWQLF